MVNDWSRLIDLYRRLASRPAGFFRRVHRYLVGNYRFYAAGSTALADYKANDITHQNYYFTVNAFLGALALIVVVTSLLAFLPGAEFKRQVNEGISNIMPILSGPEDASLNLLNNYQGIMGILSLGFLVWAGTRLSDALVGVFGIIWRTGRRPYTKKKLVGFLMIVVIGMLFLLTTFVQLGFNTLWASLFETKGVDYYLGVSLAKPIIGFLINFLLFLFIYRVVPGKKSSVKHCAAGAVLAAVLFLGSQYILLLYINFVEEMPRVYGSLASGIIVMLWMQLTGMVIFYGAELVYVLENGHMVLEHRDEVIHALESS